jgi:O-antigen ligase
VVIVFGLIVLLGWWLVPVATSQLDLNPGSVSLRTDSWQSGTDLIERSPVFGHGWAVGGAVESNRSTSPPYNLWINLAASTGILGAVLFAVFVTRLLGATMHSRSPEAMAAFPFLLGFMAQSLGEMTLYAASPGSMLFMALAGAALAAATRDGPQHGHLRTYAEVAAVREPARTTRWRGSPPR